MLGEQRLHFTDAQRRRLAEKAKCHAGYTNGLAQADRDDVGARLRVWWTTRGCSPGGGGVTLGQLCYSRDIRKRNLLIVIIG